MNKYKLSAQRIIFEHSPTLSSSQASDKKKNLHVFYENVRRGNNYKVLPFKEKKNDIGKIKYYPPVSKEWKNSIYIFNRNNFNNLPIYDNVINYYIERYFNIRFYYKNINLQNKPRKFKREGMRKIFVSKAEIKQTNSKVILTLYTYNREKISLLKKLKLLRRVSYLKVYKYFRQVFNTDLLPENKKLGTTKDTPPPLPSRKILRKVIAQLLYEFIYFKWYRVGGLEINLPDFQSVSKLIENIFSYKIWKEKTNPTLKWSYSLYKSLSPQDIKVVMELLEFFNVLFYSRKDLPNNSQNTTCMDMVSWNSFSSKGGGKARDCYRLASLGSGGGGASSGENKPFQQFEQLLLKFLIIKEKSTQIKESTLIKELTLQEQNVVEQVITFLSAKLLEFWYFPFWWLSLEERYKFINILFYTQWSLFKRYKLRFNLNQYKFEERFLYLLSTYISRYYKKKVIWNIVNLKSFILNSDLLTKILTLKMKNKEADIIVLMRIILNKVELPKINRVLEKSRSVKAVDVNLLENKYKNVGYAINSIFNNYNSISNSNSNFQGGLEECTNYVEQDGVGATVQPLDRDLDMRGNLDTFLKDSYKNVYDENYLIAPGYARRADPFSPTEEKPNPHFPLLKIKKARGASLHSIGGKDNLVAGLPSSASAASAASPAINEIIFNSINYKNLGGVRFKVSGRLTRRYKSDRSVQKIKWKGGLKNIDASYKGLSTITYIGYIKPNIEYSIYTSKRPVGAFAVKGWIAGK